jgi:oxalate decarboxylase
MPLRFLEMFKSSTYADVSLNRWMALTPPALVQGTLKLDQSVMSALRRGPAPVVPV